jgi:hypothetical protein
MGDIRFLGASAANYTKGRTAKITHIVLHYTAGAKTAEGAAYANCTYFSNGSRNASAHYFIDDGPDVWQSVALGDTAWHAGQWDMNTRSIGIEVCTAGDYTDREVATLGRLVRELMDEYGIPAANVIRHYDVTGKQCPAAYVNEAKWKALKGRLLDGQPTGVGVQQYEVNYTPAQRWRVKDEGNGVYCFQSVARPDLWLDLQGNLGKSGQPVWAYSGNGSNAQKWRLDWREAGLGRYAVIHPHDHPRLSLDVAGGSQASQAAVRVWDDNGTGAQRWLLVPTGVPGEIYIVNANSLKALDVIGGGK